MSAIVKQKTHTAEEYLVLERAAPCKSEFHAGYIYAMTGASREHNLLSVNIASELRSQLKGRPCETYINDMRVKAAATHSYHYPDVTVVCGSPELEDEHGDTLLNPTLLIEVLSRSTEAYDRGDKFANYRKIPSLREYLLVTQHLPRIERYVRQGDVWLLTEADGLAASLALDSIGCTLALSEVYDRVFADKAGSE
ncbi:MAG: Uma2 family endonuclease [Methylococcaceae bacterium]|nr:Uma2 family endonuclease [Methylococcaceae bacterium]